MVGAEDIGDLAWSIEDMLNRVLDGRINCSTPLVELVEQTVQRMPLLVTAFAEGLPLPTPEVSQAIISSASQLARGEIEDPQKAAAVELAEEKPEVAPPQQEPEIQQPEELEAQEAEAIEDQPVETEAEDSIQPKEELQEEAKKPVDDAVSEEEQHEAILLEIFVNEAQGHLKTIDEFIAATRAMAPLYKAPPLSLQRALHTLKGTAEMADFTELGQLVAPLEAFIKELYHHQICLDEDIVQLVEDGAAFFRSILHSMTDGNSEVGGGLAMYRARLAELREKAVGHLLSRGEGNGSGKDFSAVKKLMAEGLLSLQNYDQLYAHLQRQTAPPGWFSVSFSAISMIFSRSLQI